MRTSLTLFRLQQIDTQITIINNRISIINNYLTQDTSVFQADQQSEIYKSILTNLNSLQNDLEVQAKSLRVKINQTESNLYDGKIKNPKDLKDLEKETFILKTNLEELEESLLYSMDEVETNQLLEISVNKIQSNVHINWEKKYHFHEKEKEILKNKLHSLSIERSALIPSILPETLTEYENLRRIKQGLAVTGVRDHTCMSCGASLTLALVQAARSSSEITYCPSCGRFLFCE